jgi:hypothetical protein
MVPATLEAGYCTIKPMRSIGAYRLDAELGRGAMGVVFRGFDESIGRPVAVKIILASEFATADERAAMRLRFSREAAAAGKLSHPNIVTVYDFDEQEGTQFLVLELVEGASLDTLLADRAPDPEGVLNILRQVAEGLDYAHREGVVHRDIKPANILVRPDGTVKITDFGIARLPAQTVTRTGSTLGTLSYMAPEQLMAQKVTGRADQYSLAVVAYQMLCGRMPLSADTEASLMLKIITETPLPLHAVNPALPRAASGVIATGLAKDPERRFATCAEMIANLSEAFSGRTFSAAVAASIPPGATTVGIPAAEPAKVNREQAAQAAAAIPTRKGPIARVTAALALAAILGFAAINVPSYLRARDLQHAIESEQLTDLDQIWAKWTELSSGMFSSLLLNGPRDVVKRKFTAAADTVIDSYRSSDSQMTYEKDWERARTMAARALAVDPDETTRGKLRICEGHLARISGTAHRSSQELNVAVERFTQAQRLLPKSPDPELGLARVYVYGLKDIDKGYAALQQAQQRGYSLTNREKQMVADGYRDRADRLYWDSRNLRGLPPEKDQIQRAGDDYKRAEDLYQNIAPWGNSTTNLIRVRTAIENVNSRLHEIDGQMRPH